MLKSKMPQNPTITFMRLTLVSLAMALGLLVSACSPHRVAYRGENLLERESGINVTASEENHIIAVTSSRFHYSLILPYSDKWDFSWKSDQLLQGRAGGVHMNLTAIRSGDSIPAHLRKLRKRMSGAIPGLESTKLITHKGERVLVTVVDGARATQAKALNGVKHLNIFSARKRSDVLYLLHISTPFVKGKGAKGLHREFLDYATAGFDINYMRDVGEIEDTLEFGSGRRRGIPRQN